MGEYLCYLKQVTSLAMSVKETGQIEVAVQSKAVDSEDLMSILYTFKGILFFTLDKVQSGACTECPFAAEVLLNCTFQFTERNSVHAFWDCSTIWTKAQ